MNGKDRTAEQGAFGRSVNGSWLAICLISSSSLDDIDTLLRYADIAMYYAKEYDRNNYQFYNPAINVRSLERIRLESSLRRTVERSELVMHYQPLIDINTRRIVCAEALARWQHPDKGLLEPDRFIPLAEETGFIAVIDKTRRAALLQ